MAVEVSLVHVAALGHAGHKDPQTHEEEDALPHGGGDLVPHLLVEMVDLLESLEVVEARGRIGKGPHAQIMHVRHDLPVVAERGLLPGLQELVPVGRLLVVV